MAVVEEYVDRNGKDIEVGSRVKIPNLEPLMTSFAITGTITEIVGYVESEGRPEIRVEFDDGDVDFFHVRLEHAPSWNDENDLIIFKCDELERLKL